jgi:hypothetical protein
MVSRECLRNVVSGGDYLINEVAGNIELMGEHLESWCITASIVNISMSNSDYLILPLPLPDLPVES